MLFLHVRNGCNPSDKLDKMWSFSFCVPHLKGLCNSEYLVYTEQWRKTLDAAVSVQNQEPQFIRSDGEHAFWKISCCRQYCIVSDERMQCDSYNYDSEGGRVYLKEKTTHIWSVWEVRGVITLSLLCMLCRTIMYKTSYYQTFTFFTWLLNGKHTFWTYQGTNTGSPRICDISRFYRPTDVSLGSNLRSLYPTGWRSQWAEILLCLCCGIRH